MPANLYAYIEYVGDDIRVIQHVIHGSPVPLVSTNPPSESMRRYAQQYARLHKGRNIRLVLFHKEAILEELVS